MANNFSYECSIGELLTPHEEKWQINSKHIEENIVVAAGANANANDCVFVIGFLFFFTIVVRIGNDKVRFSASVVSVRNIGVGNLLAITVTYKCEADERTNK